MVTYSYCFRSELLHLLYNELDKIAKEQKLQKLCGLADPYLERSRDGHTSIDWQLWPEVEYPDIYYFLIATPSLHTGDCLKAYKSLDAYNYYASGWVDNIKIFSIPSRPGTYLITARVKHSQKLSANPVKPLGGCGTARDGGVCTLHLYGRFRRSMLTHCSPPVYSQGKHSSKKRTACTYVPLCHAHAIRY